MRTLGINCTDGDILLEAQNYARANNLRRGDVVRVPLYVETSHDGAARVAIPPQKADLKDSTAEVLIGDDGVPVKILRRPPVTPEADGGS